MQFLDYWGRRWTQIYLERNSKHAYEGDHTLYMVLQAFVRKLCSHRAIPPILTLMPLLSSLTSHRRADDSKALGTSVAQTHQRSGHLPSSVRVSFRNSISRHALKPSVKLYRLYAVTDYSDRAHTSTRWTLAAGFGLPLEFVRLFKPNLVLRHTQLVSFAFFNLYERRSLLGMRQGIGTHLTRLHHYAIPLWTHPTHTRYTDLSISL